MISIRRSRTVLLPVLLPVLLFSLILLAFNRPLKWLQHPFTLSTNHTSADVIPSSPFHPLLVDFWALTSRALVEAKPDCTLPNEHIEAPLSEFASLDKNFDFRPDLLNLPHEDVNKMRDAHARFFTQISELAQKLPYAKGTQGIAVAASGALLPVFLVSLKMLRRTGSILPLEVFMESKEQYEKEICEIVLPPMNATCMILSDVLEAVPEKLTMSRHQLKALALAFSSFEDVLLLDADNIPLEKPEHLLDSEPFSSTGFVSWPDYYANTASPHYYTISSQPIPPTSSRAASEAGQLLLSKASHAPTVLLTLYYNAYGPTHYYKLLSQNPASASTSALTTNSSQDGNRDRETETSTDKETYLAAAVALHNNDTSIYTVTTPPRKLGYTHSHKNEFVPAGSIHHNPHDDYSLHTQHNTSVKSPRPSFLHANVHKTDASKLPHAFNYQIRSQRMWGPKEETLALFGGGEGGRGGRGGRRDVEKQVWAEMLYTGCHLRGAFRAWANETDVCTKIGRVYKFLFN